MHHIPTSGSGDQIHHSPFRQQQPNQALVPPYAIGGAEQQPVAADAPTMAAGHIAASGAEVQRPGAPVDEAAPASQSAMAKRLAEARLAAEFPEGDHPELRAAEAKFTMSVPRSYDAQRGGFPGGRSPASDRGRTGFTSSERGHRPPGQDLPEGDTGWAPPQ